MEISPIETMSGHPKKQFLKNNWHYVTNNIFNDINYGFNNHGHFLRNRPLHFLARVKPNYPKQLQQLSSRQIKHKDLFDPRKKRFDNITSPHSRAPPTPVQISSYSPEPVLRNHQPLLEHYEPIRQHNGGRKLSQAAHNAIHQSLKLNDSERLHISGAKYSLPYGRNAPYQNSLTPRLLPQINRVSHTYEGDHSLIKPQVTQSFENNGMSRNSFINKMKHPKLREYAQPAELNKTDIVRSSVPYKIEARHNTLDPVGAIPVDQNYRTVEKEATLPQQEYNIPDQYQVDSKKVGFKVSRLNNNLQQAESLVNFEDKRHSVDIGSSAVLEKQDETKNVGIKLSNQENSRNKYYQVALHDLQNRGEQLREPNGTKKEEKIKAKNQQRQIQRLVDQEFKDIAIGRREEIPDPNDPNFSALKGILEKNKKTFQNTQQEIQGIRKVQQVSYRNMLDDQIRQKQQFDSVFGLQNPVELRKLVKSQLKVRSTFHNQNTQGLLGKQSPTQRALSPHMIPSHEISYAQLAKTDRRLNKPEID